jgi:hypothetical protein
MSAHMLLGCQIAQGRDDEAREVLRDHVRHLDAAGGRASIYRTVFGGSTTGSVLIYVEAENPAVRAVILDKLQEPTNVASNPYVKATATTDPPLLNPTQSLVRSVDPDLPMLPLTRLRMVRVVSAPFDRRAEMFQVLNDSREHMASVGATGAGYLIETAGPSSDLFAFFVSADDMVSLEAIEVRATVPVGPFATALREGWVTPVSRRVDLRYEA